MRSTATTVDRSRATRDALLLALLAVGIVAAKAALRWHLHITGHAMLATVLLLLLARLCVARRGAASTVGLLAGLAAASMGMGKGGPLIVLKGLLPGVFVDLAAWTSPERLLDPRKAALIGAVAGASHFVPMVLFERVAGLPWAVAATHAGISALAKAGFGAVGGWAAAVIGRRLQVHGLLPTAASGAPRARRVGEGRGRAPR